jgi:hypothetical protein
MAWSKRGSERKRLSYPATIYRRDRSVLCGCTVLDMSDTGARLKLEKNALEANMEIPLEFYLSFTERAEVLRDELSVVRRCQAVWQKEDEVGVRFFKKRVAS